MAGALRKTMIYLGLSEDDEHYDADTYDEVDDDRRASSPNLYEERSEPAPAAVTPLKRQPARLVTEAPVSELHRITTIHPRTYNEAKTIGEHFRDGTPVIMNLTDMDDADAKRLIDFSAGLIFGLHGSIERVTSKVFLLTPSTVEVAVEQKSATNPRGFFNQS